MIHLALLATVLSACSPADSTLPTSTTSTPSTTTSSAAPEAAIEWDSDLAARLIELETGSDGEWTIDSAIEAVELLKPVLDVGVDAYPPIDITRLLWFLGENVDQLDDDQRRVLTAAHAGPSLMPIGYGQVDEGVREAFQLAAETASSEFAARTGYTLNGEIVIAATINGSLSNGLSAAAKAPTSSVDELSWLLATPAEVERMKELYEEAAADGDTVCVILIGQRFRNRLPAQRNASIFHEVVHCHAQLIHPEGTHGYWRDTSPWMDEGYATWAGEAFVGGTPMAAPFWDTYHDGIGPIGGHRTVEGSYDGVAFFSYVHDNGVDGWDSFQNWFGNVRARPGSEEAKFQAIFSLLSQEARARWAATSLQRATWSDIWTYTTGPGIGNSTVTRTPRPTPVAPDLEVSYALAPSEQGTFEFEPLLRGAPALLLQVELDVGGVIRWPWGTDQVSTGGLAVTWCVGDECVCDDGRELGPPAPDFSESGFVTVALTGGAVNVSLTTPEDPCEEEEEPTPGTGPCPGGIWTADPQATEDLMLSLYRDLGIADPTYEGGPITMSFFDDGSFRFDYVDTTFTETIDGIPARFVLNGGSFGTWESDATTLTVVIEGQDIQLQLYLQGNLSLTSAPPGGTGGGSVSYNCDGNEVLEIDPTFEQPFWPYPRKWARVDS